VQAFAALVGGGTALSTCTGSVRELVRGPRWASDEQVAAVDRRGAELDDDLARAGDGVVDLLEAEGAALADDHCLHGSDRMALSAPGATSQARSEGFLADANFEIMKNAVSRLCWSHSLNDLPRLLARTG